jgi:WhiB family redox-sensing transcriptional regulator
MISRRETISPVAVHLSTRREDDWRTFANCAGLDVDDFFPDNRGHQVPQQVIAVCANCEVVQQCLDWALRMRITEGLYAGTTPSQRRGMKLGDPAPIINARCAACGGPKKSTRTKYCRRSTCRTVHARKAAAATRDALTQEATS